MVAAVYRNLAARRFGAFGQQCHVRSGVAGIGDGPVRNRNGALGSVPRWMRGQPVVVGFIDEPSLGTWRLRYGYGLPGVAGDAITGDVAPELACRQRISGRLTRRRDVVCAARVDTRNRCGRAFRWLCKRPCPGRVLSPLPSPRSNTIAQPLSRLWLR